jgi:hypothetical protein
MTFISYRFLRATGFLIVAAALALPAAAQVAVQPYNGHDAVAQEVLVKSQQPAPGDTQAAADMAADIQQAKITAEIDSEQSVGSQGWALWHSRSSDVSTLIGLLTNAPGIARVEPNWIAHITSTPNGP